MRFTHSFGIGDVVKYGLGKAGIHQKPGCWCPKIQNWLNSITPGYRPRQPENATREHITYRALVTLADGPIRNGWGARGVRISIPGQPTRWLAPISGGVTCSVVSDGSVSDTQAKINAAVAGDTVCLPSGTLTWTSGISISKVITLAGGAGSPCTGTSQNNLFGRPVPIFTSCPTRIINNAAGSLITVTEQVSGSPRIRDIWFQVGTGPTAIPGPFGHIQMNNVTGAQPIIVQENLFTGLGNNTAVHATNRRGILSRNTAIGVTAGVDPCLNTAALLRNKISDSNMLPWASAPSYGDLDQIYVEDNYIKNVMQNDNDDYTRAVWRGNISINSNFGTHGMDSSPVGARHREVYYNQFGFSSTGDGCSVGNFASYVGNRGGTTLVFFNDMPNVTGNYQATTAELSVGLWLLNYSGGQDARVRCWGVGGDGGAWWPAPHQPGWGYTAGASHTFPVQESGGTGTDYPQDREPLYVWGNTGTGDYNNPVRKPAGPGTCTNPAALSDYLVNGRDIITATSSPGTSVGTTNPLPCTEWALRWRTDEGVWRTGVAGTHGRAYQCKSGAWQLLYTPGTYPHPLLGAAPPPPPPGIITPNTVVAFGLTGQGPRMGLGLRPRGAVRGS